TVNDDYLLSTPLGGPLGKLVDSDNIWLIDYECPDPPSALCVNNRGLPNHALGFAKTHFAMMSGSNMISASWTVPPLTNSPQVTFDDQSMRDRLNDNLVGHIGPQLKTLMTSAVVPSFSMPAATQLREDGGLADPVMIPLANSPNGTLDPAVNPFTNGDALPAAVVGTWSNGRVVNGTELTSGYVQVEPPATTGMTVLEPCVDMAAKVTIHDPSTVADPIALNMDAVALPFVGTDPQLEVTFTLADTEPPLTCKPNNIVTQACSVTVFEFDASGRLHTKRVVDTVVTPPMVTVEIDSSAFEIDHDFVLGIVCRSGYDPGAFSQGRFDAVQYPFSTSTHYSAVFHTMPPT
ncbi:MAG TPA: hypothetical protein VGO00_17255, partial [Kofleriaceae bacterium]|nr:hypothetical protein [Kofleriaceae bacterium]